MVKVGKQAKFIMNPEKPWENVKNRSGQKVDVIFIDGSEPSSAQCRVRFKDGYVCWVLLSELS